MTGGPEEGSTAWSIVTRRSTAAEFHALPFPDPPVSQIWVHELTAPALVLGSTQRDDVVDRAAVGLGEVAGELLDGGCQHDPDEHRANDE